MIGKTVGGIARELKHDGVFARAKMSREIELVRIPKAEINEKLEKPDLIFKGYCTDYRYYNFNFWEYSEAMFADKWDANNNPLRNVPAGHAIGHASDSIMELTITSGPHFFVLF